MLHLHKIDKATPFAGASRWLLVLIFWLLEACNGSGCGGCANAPFSAYPDPIPAGGEPHNDAIRVHLSQNVLDYIKENLDTLLEEAFSATSSGTTPVFQVIDGQAVLNLSGLSSDSDTIQLSEASTITLDLNSLQEDMTLEWFTEVDTETGTTHDGIRLILADIKLFTDLVLITNFSNDIVPKAACHVKERPGQPALRIATMALDLFIGFGETANGTTQLVLTPGPAAINVATPTQEPTVQLNITPCTTATCSGNTTCDDSGSDCEEVCAIAQLTSDLGDFILDGIQPTIDSAINQTGGLIQTSFAEALNSILSTLPLQIETAFSPAILTPTFAASNDIYFKTDAGPELLVADSVTTPGLDFEQPGLEFELTSGLTAHSAPCAQHASPPDIASLIGPPPNYTGFVEVVSPNGESRLDPYHAVLSASQALLTQGAWSAYRAGMLCFNLESDQIAAMTGGELSLNAALLLNLNPSLDGLFDREAPISLRVNAQNPPYIRLGAGHPIAENPEDPHIEITMNEMLIDISVFIDDVFTRLTGIRVNVRISLSLEQTPSQTIQLVVDNIEIANFTQIYNELSPITDFGNVLDILLQIAIDSMLQGQTTFTLDPSNALSDALGTTTELRLNTIRRDLGTEGTPYLSVYASFCSEDDINDETNEMCTPTTTAKRRAHAANTRFSLDHNSLYKPADRSFFSELKWIAQPSGMALIELESTSAHQPHEYQFRVDGGIWSPYALAQDGLIEITNPRLKLLGKHQIDIRERILNTPQSATDAISLNAMVDPERPTVSIKHQGGNIKIVVDELASPETVQIYRRISTEESISDWEKTNLSFPTPRGEGIVEVFAQDEAGNSSKIVQLLLHGDSPHLVDHNETDSTNRGGTKCSSGTPLPWFLILGAPLLNSRKRRTQLPTDQAQ